MLINKKDKKAWHFVTRFFIVYLFLTLAYEMYLSFHSVALDPFTTLLSEIVQYSFDLSSVDYMHSIEGAPIKAKFFYQDRHTFSIIQGCNAIDIIIIYLSFLFGYKKSLTHYLIHIPSGILVIELMNILRLNFLGQYILYDYETTIIIHNTIFPAILYAVVFGLWYAWHKS